MIPSEHYEYLKSQQLEGNKMLRKNSKQLIKVQKTYGCWKGKTPCYYLLEDRINCWFYEAGKSRKTPVKCGDFIYVKKEV
jgi:hypothetical protein